MLNIIHAKFSLLSNVIASGLNDFRPLSEVPGGGRDLVLWNIVVLMNIYIADW
ncbi:hypothetical protein ACLK1T_24445 [Escherichia coli]